MNASNYAIRPGEIAALFFDIDGTIVWRDLDAAKRGEHVPRFDRLAPSSTVCKAFSKLRENGHLPFICTGRSYCQIPQSIRELNPSGYLLEAGSFVSFGNQILRESVIPRDLLEKTVRELERLGIDAEFESNDGILGFYPTGESPRFPDYPVARSAIEFLEKSWGQAIAKYCVHDYSKVNLEAFKPFASCHYNMCDLTHDVMEFTLFGCDKGSAIRLVLDSVDLISGPTFAFGDSENDMPMAAEVDCFVAMGNALESVRDRAHCVTLPVWEDGVPFALKKLGLI